MKTERVSTTNTGTAVLRPRVARVESIFSQHARVETEGAIIPTAVARELCLRLTRENVAIDVRAQSMHHKPPNSSAQNMADELTYMSRPYLDPTKAVARRLDHAGYLVMQAMTLFESNRDAAWGCLSDAWTLLPREPGRFSMIPQSRRVNACFGGLAPCQAKRVLSYVEDNLGSKIAVQELADVASLSRSHFARAFKQCMGCPPMAYVAARRLERAKLMMTSTREMLASIALACGYGDQSHLTKRFRQVIGVSPGRWRRMAMFLPE
jgi:AraC family transcriptional regulator